MSPVAIVLIAIAVIVPDVQLKSHSSDVLGPICRTMLDTYFGYAAPPAMPKSSR